MNRQYRRTICEVYIYFSFGILALRFLLLIAVQHVTWFTVEMAESESSQKQYIVRFENNNSKRWNGKEVWLDATISDELYNTSELFNGANITVPWKGK